MNKCRICGIGLNSDNCHKSQANFCKKCWKDYKKRHSKPCSKERIQENNARPRSRFNRLLVSAKKRGHEVELTFEEFSNLMNEPCVYCQNKLGSTPYQGSNLDRIDNSKGYTINNIQPCCKICNNIRGKFLTVDETHVVVQALLKHRGLL